MSDPVLHEVSMHLVLPNEPVKGTIVSNELCMRGKSSSYVRHVSIDVSGTPLEGNFRSGQSFGVFPEGLDHNGKPHKLRLYSIASASCGEDGEGKVLSTTCKRLIDEYEAQTDREDSEQTGLFHGICSNYIADRKPGDEILVTGPAGKRFVLPVETEKHDYLFLATGTGVAPFRGMVKDLFEGTNSPCCSDVHLVIGTPYTSDLLYDDFFEEIDAAHPNFHYHRVISREVPQEGDRYGHGYVHHYLDKSVELHQELLQRDRTLIYICGLAGMQTGVFKTLATQGLGESYLKLKGESAEIDPADWQEKDIRRWVRPTHRCMLEVY